MKKLGFEIEEEEDEVVAKGRLLSDGGYSSMIGMYPIFTVEKYKWTIGKLILYSFCLAFTPLHLLSLRRALKAGKIDVSIENASFFLMLISHELIFMITLVKKDLIREMFRKIGSKFFLYKEPLTDEQKEIFNGERVMFLFKANFNITVIAVVCYFLSLPSLKVYLSGKWSTETGVETEYEYPYNQNLPVRLAVPFTTETPAKFIPWALCLMILSLTGSLFMTCCSNMFLGISVQIWNQLQLLNSSLKRIKERARYVYEERGYPWTQDSFDSKEYKQCLVFCFKENVRHHVEIIRFYNDFKEIFARWSFLQLLLSGLIISFNIYGVLRIDTNKSTIRILAESGGKILLVNMNVLHACFYCLAGQRISNLSEDLYEAFYFTDWHISGSQTLKECVIISLTFSKEPWIIKGYGIIPASAETLVDILKTSFSLLSFVKFVIG